MISAAPAFCAEIFEIKTGDSLVVESCKQENGQIVVQLCSTKVSCSYDESSYICNRDNGSCKTSWVQSAVDLGLLKYSKDLDIKSYKEIVEAQYVEGENEKMSVADVPSPEQANLIKIYNNASIKCPFKEKNKRLGKL